MNFESGERAAKVINHAVDVKQDIFNKLEEILGEDVTEDDAVLFFSSLAVMFKITSQLARVANGCSPAHIKQLLQEDCVGAKVIMNELFPNVLSSITKEASPEVSEFLEAVEFFEYPDSEIAKWNLNLEPKLNIAQ